MFRYSIFNKHSNCPNGFSETSCLNLSGAIHKKSKHVIDSQTHTVKYIVARTTTYHTRTVGTPHEHTHTQTYI